MTKEPYTKPDTKEKVSHKDMSLKEAAEMALEALAWGQVDDAKEALQVALSTEGNTKRNLVKTYCGGKPNYCVDGVNMSQECVDEMVKGGHKWVGLTKEEFEESVDGLEDLEDCWVQIEAKLREKNT